jgi:3'(2'), 5'-bisphosphate nucleotidase
VTTGSNLLDCLLEIAGRAAAFVLATYESDFDVELKGPDDPVTSADRGANRLICDALRDSFPGCPVVAEESDPSVFGDYRHAARVFFVDPIDGTREFVLRRTGEFVVMIGCLEEQQATAGVVWAPTVDTVWVGQLGIGAFRRKAAGDFVAIRPAEKTDPASAKVLVSRSLSTEDVQTLRLGLGVALVDAMASVGLKGAAVADGTADAYVAPRRAGNRWDVCAPDAILSAAGGLFTDGTGKAIDYRSEDLVNRRGLVAANAELHPELVKRLGYR